MEKNDRTVHRSDRLSVRTKIPILTGILGLFLLLIGMGGQWLFQASVKNTAEISIPQSGESAKVMRIPSEAGGSSGYDFTMKGDGPWDVSLIRSVDAAAWIGDAQQIVLNRDGENLVPEVTGQSSTALAQNGMDIFAKTTVQRGDTAQRIPPVQSGQMYDVIIIGKDGAALPRAVAVSRSGKAPQPWALPMMIIGGIILLASMLWFLLERRRRRAAPQNLVQAAGSHRAPRALSVLAVLGLAGTALVPGGSFPLSLQRESTPAPSSSVKDTTPTVSGPQLAQIVTEVSSVLTKADASKDKGLLATRATGAALTLRSSNYDVRSKNPKAAAPGSISSTIVTSMVPYADSFPRTVVAVVQETSNDLPRALVLEQKDVHSQYRVRGTMAMLPGAHFPKPSSDPSARALRDIDKGTAAMSGRSALDALSGYLQHPTGPQKDTFESTAFQTELIDFQKQVRQNTKDATVNFTQTVDYNETRVMPTADGGSMVFGYLFMRYTAAPKSKGGTLDLTGTPYEKLVGQSTVKGPITVGYGESVMIYVPKAGASTKPVVTGVDQDLLFARKG
jgi:hypothetical protein